MRTRTDSGIGKLVRGLRVQRQWLGFLMIHKLAATFMQHSLENGCLSFDIVIMRMLGVVLQCACNSRPGDIARSSWYSGKECLLFKDVELKLKPGGKTVQDLEGKVTLRYVKGKK